MSTPADTRLPALHTRIRRRRQEMGLTGTDLAVRAGISTSYVSLIETGAKVPDEEAAARLARALDDDEGLYRAWARASRLGLHDLAMLNGLDAIARTPAFATLVESGRALPPLTVKPATEEDAVAGPDLAARLREVAYHLDPAAPGATVRPVTSPRTAPEEVVVRVPVRRRDGEPHPLGPAARRLALEPLLLDRRLLESARGALFAYEVLESDMKHLRGVAASGDRVVLQEGGVVAPDRICAVRTSAGVRLSRCLASEDRLLLLPGDGETEFETVFLPAGDRASAVLVGTHVLLLRG